MNQSAWDVNDIWCTGFGKVFACTTIRRSARAWGEPPHSDAYSSSIHTLRAAPVLASTSGGKRTLFIHFVAARSSLFSENFPTILAHSPRDRLSSFRKALLTSTNRNQFPSLTRWSLSHFDTRDKLKPKMLHKRDVSIQKQKGIEGITYVPIM